MPISKDRYADPSDAADSLMAPISPKSLYLSLMLSKRLRGFVLWFLLTLTIAFLWGGVIWPRRYVFPQVFGRAVFSVQASAPLLALTFDDGPDPRYTLPIVTILAKRGIKATFFMVGNQIQAYPEVVRQVMAQGHEIGNHTWSHRSLNLMGPARIRQQIEDTDQILRGLGYQGTIPFRPPFGHSMLFLPWVLNQMERPNIFWSADPRDWEATNSEQILAALKPQIHHGGIILLHDGDANPRNPGQNPRDPTIAALPLLLDTYLAQGYRFVTLSELLETSAQAWWQRPLPVAVVP